MPHKEPETPREVLASQPYEVTRGSWGEVPWVFYADRWQPPTASCSAAFCIPYTSDGRVMLIKQHQRGYEFPGGHMEENSVETAEDAALRETLEEARAVLRNIRQVGYKEIRTEKPIPHRDNPEKTYPNPGYVPYFVAEVSETLEKPLADDVTDVVRATLAEAKRLLAPGHNHEVILEYFVTLGLVKIK